MLSDEGMVELLLCHSASPHIESSKFAPIFQEYKAAEMLECKDLSSVIISVLWGYELSGHDKMCSFFGLSVGEGALKIARCSCGSGIFCDSKCCGWRDDHEERCEWVTS